MFYIFRGCHRQPLYCFHFDFWYVTLDRYIYIYVCVNVQAKRALSHCYQNVQNVSKQPNNTKFLVLFDQIAHIVISSESIVMIGFVLFENEAFSSSVQSRHFKLYGVMQFHLECGFALNDVMNFHWSVYFTSSVYGSRAKNGNEPVIRYNVARRDSNKAL